MRTILSLKSYALQKNAYDLKRARFVARTILSKRTFFDNRTIIKTIQKSHTFFEPRVIYFTRKFKIVRNINLKRMSFVTPTIL